MVRPTFQEVFDFTDSSIKWKLPVLPHSKWITNQFFREHVFFSFSVSFIGYKISSLLQCILLWLTFNQIPGWDIIRGITWGRGWGVLTPFLTSFSFFSPPSLPAFLGKGEALFLLRMLKAIFPASSPKPVFLLVYKISHSITAYHAQIFNIYHRPMSTWWYYN